MKVDDYLLKLEKNLMIGGGRWVADFTESFRDYSVDDITFDMMIRGNTRTKGFLLSRIVAYFSLPDYLVACFVYPSKEVDRKTLDSLLRVIKNYMEKNNLTWSWLVIPKEGSFSRRSKRLIEKTEIREIGVALVDLASQEITSSHSYLGKRMPRFIRCFK